MAQGIKKATYTSLTTGITEQTLNGGNDITIPKGIKQIVGIEPIVVPVTPTANESVLAKVKLTSTDIALYNCEFLANPSAAILGATGQMHVAKSKFWPLYVPVNGGEKVQIKGTALVANSVAPLMGANLYLSDQPPILPQRKGKIGTLTTMGTAAAKVVTDAAFQVTGGSILESVYGAVVPTTVAASNPIIASGNVISSDLLPPFPIEFPITPVGAGLGALIAPTHDGIVEADIAIAMASTTNMELSITMERAVSVAPNGVVGVVYV